MKKLCYSLCFLFFIKTIMITNSIYCQDTIWHQQYSGTTANLNSVHFADSNNGWIAGDGGTILKTANGGQNWLPVNSGIIGSQNLNNIIAINSDTALTLKTFPHTDIYRTTDAGATWQNVFFHTNSYIVCAIHMIDKMNGIAYGDPDSKWRVFKTTDCGSSWFRIETEPINSGGNYGYTNLLEVVDSLHWWFSSEDGWVYRTIDGGLTWSYINSGITGALSISFVDTLSGWMAGSGGIYKTTDGGVNWFNQTSGATGCVHFKTPYVGWSNKTGILNTIDGGANWYSQCSQSVSSIYFTDLNNGWAVGPGGTIFYTSNGLTSSNSPPYIYQVSQYPLIPINEAQITAVIIDDYGLSDVKIFYSANAVFDSVTMDSSGGYYTGQIPAQPNGSLVYYYVKVVDDSGLVDISDTYKYFSGTAKISTLRFNDGNGLSTYLGMPVRVRGIVTAGDSVFSQTNTDIFLQDTTGGIHISVSGSWNNFPEGTDLTVEGTISQSNGLLEITNPNISITNNGPGQMPVAVPLTPGAAFNESNEGKLVVINGVDFDAIGLFVGNFSYTFNGNPLYQIYIDGDIENIIGQSIPNGVVNVQGILTQYDNASPYDAGYRLLPRRFSDIVSAPTSLNANTVSITQINLSWNAASSNPDKYRIFRSPNYSYGYEQIDSVTAPAVTYSNTDLPSSVKFYYYVSAVYSFGMSPPSNIDSASTYAIEPLAQPSNLVFQNVGPDSLSLSFTPAGGVTGYIALRKPGSPVTEVPVDGISYTAGNTIGSADVAYVGNSADFINKNLIPNTTYYYSIFSYNGGNDSINYLTAGSLTGNKTTLLTEPNAQPAGLSFSDLGPDSYTISFSASSPAPTGYLVIRKTGSSSAFVPVDTTTYSKGQDLGAGQIVSYTGSSTSFIDSNLTEQTDYYYDVFAFNGSGNLINYKNDSPLEGNRFTLAAEPAFQPVNLSFTGADTNCFTLRFNRADDHTTGYIVLRKTGSAVTAEPSDGVTYAINDPLGDALVVYAGSDTVLPQTGLIRNTRYYYRIFSYNGSLTTTNYRTTAPLEGNKLTADFPGVTTSTASPVTGTTARLNGIINPHQLATKAFFEWGVVPNFGDTVYIQDSIRGDADTPVNRDLSSLIPNTSYQFRLVGINKAGKITGSLQTFTTNPNAPTVITNSATNVTHNSARINGSVNPNNLTTIAYFEWGLTDQYGNTTNAQNVGNGTTTINVSADLSGLLINSVYHYRLVATNSAGTIMGPDSTFRTSALAPACTTLTATNVAARTAQINASVNPNGLATTAYFEWGLTTSYGQTTPQRNLGNGISPVLIDTVLSSLNPNTIYHYRVIANNTMGTTQGADQTFTTTSYKPQVDSTRVTGTGDTSVTLKASVNPAGLSTTAHFEWGLTTAYGNVTANQSLGNGTSPMDFYQNISGLSIATTYHYRIAATNDSGTVYSNDYTFTTTGTVPTILTTTIAIAPVNLADRTVGTPIDAEVSVNGSLPSVIMTYGKGSDNTGRDTIMILSAGKYRATIPGNQVTAEGVWYRIRALNRLGTVYYPSQAGKVSVDVSVSSFANSAISLYPDGIPPTDYYLLSLPLSGHMDLSTAFGTQEFNSGNEPTNWAAFRYNGSFISTTTLTHQEALVVYQKTQSNKNITVPSGATLNLTAMNDYQLKSGWNLVPWPYTFKATITSRDSTKIGSVWRLLAGNDWEVVNEFKPFGGYAIFNKDTGTVHLGDALNWSFGTLVEKTQTTLSKLSQQPIIQFKAESGRYKDSYNFIGVLPYADDDYDAIDEIEPLGIGDGLHVYFISQANRKLCVDMRSDDSPLQEWEMIVEPAKGQSDVKLLWEMNNISDGTKLILVDMTDNQFLDLSDETIYAYHSSKTHKFKVLMGESGAIDRRLQALQQELPRNFALYPNYPNPFNPTTTIKFDIAKSGNVKLQIYNVLGQLVNTLTNGYFETGKYDIQWNGKDAKGKSVSSGIYIVRLVTDGYVKSGKMLLVR